MFRQATFLLLTDLFMLATEANAGKVFVSNEKDNTISVIDTDGFKVVATVEVGQQRLLVLVEVVGVSVPEGVVAFPVDRHQ